MDKKYVKVFQKSETLAQFIERIKKMQEEEKEDIIYYGVFADFSNIGSVHSVYVDYRTPSLTPNQVYMSMPNSSGYIYDHLNEMRQMLVERSKDNPNISFYTFPQDCTLITSDELLSCENFEAVKQLFSTKRAEYTELNNEWNREAEEKEYMEMQKSGIDLLKYANEHFDNLSEIQLVSIIYTLNSKCFINKPEEYNEYINLSENPSSSSPEYQEFMSKIAGKYKADDMGYGGLDCDYINPARSAPIGIRKNLKNDVTGFIRAYLGRSLYDFDNEKQNHRLMVDLAFRCFDLFIEENMKMVLGDEEYENRKNDEALYRKKCELESSLRGTPREVLRSLRKSIDANKDSNEHHTEID